jgi:hypothetical protein
MHVTVDIFSTAQITQCVFGPSIRFLLLYGVVAGRHECLQGVLSSLDETTGLMTSCLMQ